MLYTKLRDVVGKWISLIYNQHIKYIIQNPRCFIIFLFAICIYLTIFTFNPSLEIWYMYIRKPCGYIGFSLFSDTILYVHRISLHCVYVVHCIAYLTSPSQKKTTTITASHNPFFLIREFFSHWGL